MHTYSNKLTAVSQRMRAKKINLTYTKIASMNICTRRQVHIQKYTYVHVPIHLQAVSTLTSRLEIFPAGARDEINSYIYENSMYLRVHACIYKYIYSGLAVILTIRRDENSTYVYENSANIYINIHVHTQIHSQPSPGIPCSYAR